MKYQLSPNTQIFNDGNTRTGLVYHSLYGNPRLFNEEGLKFLDTLRNPISLSDLIELCDDDPSHIINELINLRFIVPSNSDERRFINQKKNEHIDSVKEGKTIDRIGLAISDSCNFGCNHCIHFQPSSNNGNIIPLYQKSFDKLNMSWLTAKKCIDHYIKIMKQNNQNIGRIHFGNAEPLINWPVIHKILEYYSNIEGITFKFSINTNLVLLTEDIAKILKKYNVSIATSLDGNESANNAIRITKGGKGTFQSIIEKFDLLEKINYPLDGFSITVTDKNFDLVDIDIIDFAHQRGMTSIAFDYDLVSLVDIPIELKIEKLMKLKRHANQYGIDFFGTWDSPFRNLTSASLLTEDHAFCAAVQGKALEFNVDGSIKVCGHTTTRVGHVEHINELFKPGSDFINLVQERFPGTDIFCRGCIIEGPCGGQCHVTREVVSRSQNQNHKQLFQHMCDFYREITRALSLEYIQLASNTIN